MNHKHVVRSVFQLQDFLRYDKTEILLKVALNTIKPNQYLLILLIRYSENSKVFRW